MVRYFFDCIKIKKNNCNVQTAHNKRYKGVYKEVRDFGVFFRVKWLVNILNINIL